MARNAGFTVENNFVNGLVTEATGLNFPENAVTDTDNCVFDSDGSFERRDGIDLETQYLEYSNAEINNATSEYVWESVAGDGNLTFIAQQTGRYLWLWNSSNGPAISRGLIAVLDMAGYVNQLSDLTSNTFQYATGFGKLIITHPFMNPMYIEFDKATSQFSAVPISIHTRDFKGLQPAPSGRGTATPAHFYNLFNQGWSAARQGDYLSKAGFYPSDYEVWWLYKSPDALGVEAFLTDVAIANGVLNNLDRGNSPAPKGSVILSEFYQDRSAASSFGPIPVVTSGPNRPKTCAFHAGRVFYSGVNASEFNSKVYFSQIIEDNTQFGKCYQQNDPTSQYTPDLLPTDGGVIAIPEAGTIHKLWSVDNSLLVFASTGVWQITGSTGIGFSAIDYTVKKISSIKTVSALSFVGVNGSPVWWGLDGIYGAIADPKLGGVSVESLSDEKVKTFYQDIPEDSKNYAKGAFDSKERIIQWVYRSVSSSTNAQRYSYDKILNLNVANKAFYPWSIGVGVTVKGIIATGGLGSESIEEPVTDNAGEIVTDSNDITVTAFVEQIAQISSRFKYFVNTTATSFTYAEKSEGVKGDWSTKYNGSPVVANAFVDGGYKIRGDGIRKAQSNYLRLFARPNSVLKFQSKWDYANSGNTGRWSSKQFVEFDGDGYDYASRRLKPRGHGLVFQYRFESVGTEPMSVIGWTSYDSSNGSV